MAVIQPLIPADAIAARVRELAAEIDAQELAPLHLVGVLKGAYMFVADLSRALKTPHTVDFLSISSYGDSTATSGVVRLTQDLAIPVEGKHVLLVEDIVDTGLSLSYLLRNLRTRKPASIRVATLLNKPIRRRVDVPIDHVGFEVEDRFVVGYGLDWAQFHRNLPYVAEVVFAEGETAEE